MIGISDKGTILWGMAATSAVLLMWRLNQLSR